MSNYWEERAAKRMYEDMKTAEEAAEDIRKLYRRSSLYIQTQGKGIFDAFMNQTGLSEEDARRMIAQAKAPADLKAVIDYANGIKDPAKRQMVLNWIKASATQSRLARLASLQEAITKLVPLLYANELKLHQETYSKIIQDAYLHKTFDIQQYSGYGQYVTPMNAKRIERIMRERWLGSNYSSRIWSNTNRLAGAVRDELIVSFLTGRPQLDAWRAIDDEFQKGHNAARRLIRTESNYLANQAHVEAYKDSGVDKYIYVATLDLRTSETCRGLDGKTFLVKDAQPGKNYPPMHPWCRSTTIAWIPEKLLARMKRDALDPATGKRIKVPASMTYQEWYKKYVKMDSMNQASLANAIPPEYDGDYTDYNPLELTLEEEKALKELRRLCDDNGYEYGVGIDNGDITDVFTSNKYDAIEIPEDVRESCQKIFHGHTNYSLPSEADLAFLTRENIDEIGVITYNNDVYTVSIDDGYRPTIEEYREFANSIRPEVDIDMIEWPNSEMWTPEQRVYMATREQFYRTCIHFGWTMRGGKLL